MQKIWDFLTARTSLTVIGWVAFAALLFLAARLLQWPASLPWIVLGIALSLGAAIWLFRRWRHARKAGKIGDMLDAEDKVVPLKTSRKSGFWLGAGSGAGGMAIAAALAFLVFAPANNAVVADLADAHVRSLMGEHLIDVASSDHHTVKPWFAGHSNVSPPTEDFKADGFTLVGGRADYVHGAQAAVVVYRLHRIPAAARLESADVGKHRPAQLAAVARPARPAAPSVTDRMARYTSITSLPTDIAR